MITINETETVSLKAASAKLRSCPFCGTADELMLSVNAQTLNATAACHRCRVTMKRSFSGNEKIRDLLEDLMAEAWNERRG